MVDQSGDNMISVLDYGVGNLGSIINMLKRIGVEVRLVSSPEDLVTARKILLPGVGAFDNGMMLLSASGMIEPLRKLVQHKMVKILGICLGMQMLGRESEEGETAGLGFIDAYCRRFHFPENPALKVPHMGWNLIRPKRETPLLSGLDATSRFYFVHSYYMVCNDPADVLAMTVYGGEFVSLIQHGNIMGAQFHPEKSHRFGMTLLKNFAEL